MIKRVLTIYQLNIIPIYHLFTLSCLRNFENLEIILLAKSKVVYGSKWLPAVAALQVLCFYGLNRSLLGTVENLYLAAGKPEVHKAQSPAAGSDGCVDLCAWGQYLSLTAVVLF
jgi:hypothetical protein